MTEVVKLDDGRMLVPDNRWDLVDGPVGTPFVSVIIPYYNQAAQLDRVLAALASQSYPPKRLEVVVADDGSLEPPPIGGWVSRLQIRTVRQEDEGFRAAAARNLGVAASTGSVLCFLDADTVPDVDYVRYATRLPAVAPDVLVVGRRLHEGAQVREPQWLAEAYERTDHLLRPGWDGYKYILSAVMTCARELFDAVGGFDESFVQYGGEDWEFANRAFMSGAVFAYERQAVAVHDGPDWADRPVAARTDAKNAEALALAPLITDPAARTSGLRYRVPDCVAVVSSDGHSPASLSVTVASILGGADCRVWVVGDRADLLLRQLGIDDSRVALGSPAAWVLQRCRFVLDVSGRVVFDMGSLAKLTEAVGPGKAGVVSVQFDSGADAVVTLQTSRALHRARRWTEASRASQVELIGTLFGTATVPSAQIGAHCAEAEPWLSW